MIDFKYGKFNLNMKVIEKTMILLIANLKMSKVIHKKKMLKIKMKNKLKDLKGLKNKKMEKAVNLVRENFLNIFYLKKKNG
jgi:hypothetical protein